MANPNQQHIQTILNCFQLCEQCGAECAEQGDASLADCIKLCYACADACMLCVKVLSSGIAQSKSVCRICAELCDACEAECRKSQVDVMQRCADACRQCGDLCRQMAS